MPRDNFDKLGPYLVGKRLGRGGMGTVYAAVDEESNQQVAVKVLSAEMARDEGFRDRFAAEIDSLKLLSHPNIVQLYGYGEHDGHLFYSMELVDGKSLEEALRAGQKFTWESTTDLTIQVCKALKHAHDRGIIHRDIKPANLLLTSDGKIKLSDFGIAKLFGNTGMTSDGGVLGTAEYMAPEQIDNRHVTNRCDLYSLGGVMYTLLAGRPPFRAASILELLQLQRFASPEPLRRFSPQTPSELEIIISTLLEKDPEKRIQTASVLSRRLEAMRHGLSQPPVSSPKPNGDAGDSLYTQETVDGSAILSKSLGLPGMEGYELAALNTKPSVTRAAPPSGSATNPDSATAPTMASTAEPANVEAASSTIRSFVTVEKDKAVRRHDEQDGKSAWISAETWLILACLVGVGFGAWYFLQPPSAAKLYQRIMQKAEESISKNRPEILVDADDDIQLFLANYGEQTEHAQHRDQLEELQNQIDVQKMRRRFELRAKGQDKTTASEPIERAYFEATGYARIDPDVGLAKLQALIDVYGNDQQLSPAAEQVLTVARQDMVRLSTQVQGGIDDQVGELSKHMNQASEIAKSDPDKAVKIWQGIVELYGHKPWAESIVGKARERLKNLPSKPTNPRPPNPETSDESTSK